MDRLCARIDRIENVADEIYIGRTCDPDSRRDEHFEDTGRSNLIVLHWSDDIDEVCAIEEALIREFAQSPKIANATDESLGGGRTELRNYVYVSWRHQPRRAVRSSSVRYLQGGRWWTWSSGG